MIRCLVFDFDGTLVPSNALKRNAFRDVVAEIDGAADHVAAIVAANPTLDRHSVFARFCAEQHAAGDPTQLAIRYGNVCHDGILALLATGATGELMRTLREEGFDLHIASATPRDALARLLDSAALSDLFTSLHGAPQCKSAALGEIIVTGGHHRNDVAMIGDGDDDRDAAAQIGCHFVRVGGDAAELYRADTDTARCFLFKCLDLPELRP